MENTRGWDITRLKERHDKKKRGAGWDVTTRYQLDAAETSLEIVQYWSGDVVDYWLSFLIWED
jgi:hypothetical protein